jgi:hypothetical protein
MTPSERKALQLAASAQSNHDHAAQNQTYADPSLETGLFPQPESRPLDREDKLPVAG